jgi:C-terminal processing protease CtpA/Prc
MGTKLKISGWIALGAVAGALVTMQLQATARNSVSSLPLDELQQLAAVFGMVKSDYVEPVDEKKLITDAIGGMVAGLDPHSQYFDKKSWKEFREGTTGRFVGVGIEIGMEEGLVKVVTPIEGSPAFRAGLKPGDLITRIDDSAVKGLACSRMQWSTLVPVTTSAIFAMGASGGEIASASRKRTSSSEVWEKSSYHWPTATNGSGSSNVTTSSASSPSRSTVEGGATGTATMIRPAF